MAQLALAFHLGNLLILPEIESYIENITITYDMYITMVRNYRHSDQELDDAKISLEKKYLGCIVTITENLGDTYGCCVNLDHIFNSGVEYKYILYLHTKTDPVWRKDLLFPILGTKEIFNSVINKIGPTTGLIGSLKWRRKDSLEYTHVKKSMETFGETNITNNYFFVGGTIFIVNYELYLKATSRLRSRNLTWASWYMSSRSEEKTTDPRGRTAFAFERIFGYLVVVFGYQYEWSTYRGASPTLRKYARH